LPFKGLFIGIDRYASPGIGWLSCARRDAEGLHWPVHRHDIRFCAAKPMQDNSAAPWRKMLF